jgi:ABC-type maltose transport system permease subunit
LALRIVLFTLPMVVLFLLLMDVFIRGTTEGALKSKSCTP